MGEAVADRRRPRADARCGIVARRSVSPAPRATGLHQPQSLPQRLRGVERQRRLRSPPSLSDLGMAPGTVARIHPRGVRLMTGLAALRHLSVGRANMEGNAAPGRVAVGLGA